MIRFLALIVNIEVFTRRHDVLVSLLPAVLIFVVVSSKTGFNEHFRYVLPAFPFFFVWIACVAKIFGNSWAEAE